MYVLSLRHSWLRKAKVGEPRYAPRRLITLIRPLKEATRLVLREMGYKAIRFMTADDRGFTVRVTMMSISFRFAQTRVDISIEEERFKSDPAEETTKVRAILTRIFTRAVSRESRLLDQMNFEGLLDDDDYLDWNARHAPVKHDVDSGE